MFGDRSTSSDSGTGGQSDWSVKDMAKESIRKRAKDPGSVEFADVWVGQLTTSKGTTVKVACGYFNAKNGFGGYTGQQRFISGADMPLTDETAKAMIDSAWQNSCLRFH
jgi:hypothetical protein